MIWNIADDPDDKASMKKNNNNRIVKEPSEPAVHHISSFINKSLQLCIFPGMFTLTEVSSLFKKNDHLYKGSYRSVSVLPSVSKIYQRRRGSEVIRYIRSNISADLSAFWKIWMPVNTIENDRPFKINH